MIIRVAWIIEPLIGLQSIKLIFQNDYFVIAN